MLPKANKTKIYSVGIICFGIVIAFWLSSQSPKISPDTNLAVKDTVSAEPYVPNPVLSNNDWQKILTSVSPKDQAITSVIPKTSDDTFNETSLTDQLSRDFFSRYMLVANQEGGISTNDANQIASDVLSDPSYTQSKGARYITSNLKITEETDRETVLKYNTTLTQKLASRTVKGNSDPLTILTTGLQNENEKEISKIDPYIAAYKGAVSDLLVIEVPRDAVAVHLGLINAFSNMLATIESIRVTLSDPIKGSTGLSQYRKNVEDLETALTKINQYFQKKLKTS